MFELMAVACSWPAAEWAMRLLLSLSGEAQIAVLILQASAWGELPVHQESRLRLDGLLPRGTLCLVPDHLAGVCWTSLHLRTAVDRYCDQVVEARGVRGRGADARAVHGWAPNRDLRAGVASLTAGPGSGHRPHE